MKTFYRVFCFILVLILCVNLIACKKEQTPEEIKVCFDTELEFLPMTADGINELMYNPNRGFRSAASFSLSKLAELGTVEKMTANVLDNLGYYVFKLSQNTTVVNIGIGLTGYSKTETLPDNALVALDVICDVLRSKGYVQNIIFVYNGSHHVAWTTSETAKQNTASVCASEEVMLSHIKQLAPVLAENKDTVYSIMGGFIGFSGDMAESSQYPPVDRNKVMKAIYDNLVAPNDIFYIVRSAAYIDEFIKTYPTEVDPLKIGFVNKAMFGEQTRSQWNSGGYQKGNPEKTATDWWEYVTEKSPYVPNDGELFPNSNLIGKQSHPTPRIPKGIEIILECAHHNMTTMGFWNGYYEVDRANNGPAVMDLWQVEKLTKEMLEEKNIVYDPAWFTEDDGDISYHSAFEFIRDHLGYKVTAQNGKASSDGDCISVEINLKNYGFSAAFGMESGFALLNEKFEPICEINAGEPDKWYSHDPQNPESTEVPTYTINGKLNAPKEKGKFYIAFYLKNDVDCFAKLSNRQMDFENGYNILCEINVN